MQQRVTKRCRLSLLTNSALVYESQCGGACRVSANEYSCAHHVTWSPNKLWRSALIYESQCGGIRVVCRVSSNEYSCANHVTWRPNKSPYLTYWCAGRGADRLGAAPRDPEPGVGLRVRHSRVRGSGQPPLLQRRHLHRHLGCAEGRPSWGQTYVSRVIMLFLVIPVHDKSALLHLPPIIFIVDSCIVLGTEGGRSAPRFTSQWARNTGARSAAKTRQLSRSHYAYFQFGGFISSFRKSSHKLSFLSRI